MSNDEVQFIVNHAVHEAVLRRHEYITVEHLLYSILQHENGVDIISNCGGNVELMLNDVLKFFLEKVPETQFDSFSRKISTNHTGSSEEEKNKVNSPIQTIGFQRVLERSMNQVIASGRKELTTGDLLAVIFMEQDSYAVYILKKQGITKHQILNYISHGKVEIDKEIKDDEINDTEDIIDDSDEPITSLKTYSKISSRLESYAVNLTELAKNEKLEPLIGREHELRRLIQVLCRKLKHNPILVGEPGVGKTAIVEGLAQKIVKKEVPPILNDSLIFTLDLGSLLAGTKFRGQFEQRLKTILNEINHINLKAKRELGAILFIDEIHMIVGAGAAGSSSIDASSLLKKALHTDNLHCIGTTTYEEYRRHFEQDRALARRFQKIDIPEVTTDDTIKILQGLRNRFEKYYNIKYTDNALKSAAHLSFKYISEHFLPDKAIDIIDEAGALNEIRVKKKQKYVIEVEDIEEVVTQIANIPDLNPGKDERDRLVILEGELRKKIFGQDKAIESIVAAIKLSRAGLNLPDQPVGSFIFAGPTGVGKTEVAKQLALILGIAFKRFDMSEYMEKHAVSRLIGAPPGYVGYDQGGLLTETIRKNPHCVLLLDEIEKAHVDLFDILLQVMDHATLTDNTGRESDFRNVIMIMTTNAGAREISKMQIGFDRRIDLSASKKAVENLFSPEFRNRLTDIILFNQLTPKIMEKIVAKFIAELNVQLITQNICLKANLQAIKWLAKNGYDEIFGARPLARLIQNTIRQPLAEEILFGKLKNGGIVTIRSTKNNKLMLDIIQNHK
jgi:ATP-dependent Clp protease ATP-binding subunit ClpA